MKLLLSFLVALVCLNTGVAAEEFWFFLVDLHIKPGGPVTKNYFNFFRPEDVGGPDHPNCTEAVHTHNKLPRYLDVSGNKYGVRREGEKLDPDVIEWNSFKPGIGHYSKYRPTGHLPVRRRHPDRRAIAVYKNRDHHIFSLEDKDVGQCWVDNSHSFGQPNACPSDSWLDITLTGTSIFRCESDDIHIPPIDWSGSANETDPFS